MYCARLIFAVALILILSIVGIVITYSEVGITQEVGSGQLILSMDHLTHIPQSVVEDATILAKELFADNLDKREIFRDQLLVTYLEAKEKDLVVIFNSGGWGWTSLEDSEQWQSVFIGMDSIFIERGYKLLWLDYKRTADNLLGCLNEFAELTTDYASKAQNLASRVKFLTSSFPDIRIIIAAESNGTVIADSVMNNLIGNQQIYSIQTGPPFWHEATMLDRTLVLKHNGINPDSFSHGDFRAMIWGTVQALFGILQPEDDSGNILYYVRAPGHDYQWQYPGVGPEITRFLKSHFTVKR